MNPEEIIKQAKLILSENNNNYIGEIKTSHHEKEIFRQDSFIKISAASPGKFQLDCEEYSTSVEMCVGFYSNLLLACSTFSNYEKRKIGLVKVVEKAPAAPAQKADTEGSAKESSEQVSKGGVTPPLDGTPPGDTPSGGTPATTVTAATTTTPAPAPSAQFEYKDLIDNDADYYLFWNNLQGTTSKTRFTFEFGVASVSNDRGGEAIVSVYDLGATKNLNLASYPSIKYSLCNNLTDLANKLIKKAKESDETPQGTKNQVTKNQFVDFMNSMFGGNSRGKA